MQEHTIVAVNERDFRITRSRGNKSRIVCEISLSREFTYVDDIWAEVARVNG